MNSILRSNTPFKKGFSNNTVDSSIMPLKEKCLKNILDRSGMFINKITRHVKHT